MQTIRRLIQKIGQGLFSKAGLLFLAAAIFSIVFWRFFSLLYFPDSSVVLEKGDPMLELNPGIILDQKFIVDRNGLSKIELMLRTPGPKNGEVVRTEIADETCKNVFREGKLEKSFISSGNLYEFRFDRIPDSENKTYCLKIESDKKKFRFFTMESDDLRSELKNTAGRSLAMRTVYKNAHWWQDLSELNQRISQYKPFFLKHHYLTSIVIIFTLLSVAIVVILIVL